MVPFFMGMALFCGFGAWRLGDRSLAVCAILFLGLAGLPSVGREWLAWYGVVIIALAMGVRYTRCWVHADVPSSQWFHHAVCRPYHSSVAFEDRE